MNKSHRARRKATKTGARTIKVERKRQKDSVSDPITSRKTLMVITTSSRRHKVFKDYEKLVVEPPPLFSIHFVRALGCWPHHVLVSFLQSVLV